ncbi:Zinc transporter [Entamoeba marina]
MEIDWELFGFVAATFCISLIGGFAPFLIRLLKNKEIAARVINVSSVAAAGLFLGGGIYHVLAEGLEMIDESGFMIVPHQHSSFDDEHGHGGHESDDDNVILLSENHHKKKAAPLQEWTGVVVLVAALSFHSFLEGLGLGSSNDPLMVFIAIAAHKWADAGLTILYLMKKNRYLFTPLGVAIGTFVIATLEDESVSLLIQGIFCCVAGGSFFFVSIVEILSEGFDEHSHQYTFDKYLKFALAVIFFIGMSLTVLLEGEE